MVSGRRRLIGGHVFEKMGVASWHIQTLPPPNSLYIWVGFSLFILEFGGQAAYMETHPEVA